MITLLSSPKPFVGLTTNNQINAIRSWLALDTDIEVILYGNSKGIEDAAREMGIRHVSDIKTNEFGTPIYSAIAEHAEQAAKYDFQVYINCDIILTPAFSGTIRSVPFPQFLLIGQRLDLAEGVKWDLSETDWQKQIARMANLGKIALHSPAGSDFFGFRRGFWKGLPPVAIGRGGYDNALILFALERRIPVVDITLTVPVVHQFHDYGHLIKGKVDVFHGPEALSNLVHAGKHHVPLPTDATWRTDRRGIIRNYGRGDWVRFFECYSRFVLHQEWIGYCFRQARRLLLRMGLSRQRSITLDDLLKSYNASPN